MGVVEIAASRMALRSMDALVNTLSMIETIQQRNGRRHAERLAEEYCKLAGVPVLSAQSFVIALGMAIRQKQLTLDPDEDLGESNIIRV